jgi:hypothetical protein
MSSYANVSVKGYNFYSLRNYVDSETTSLFTESNRRVYFNRENNEDRKSYLESEGQLGDYEEFNNYEYASSVKHVSQRLEVMGFTLDSSRREFDESVDAIKPDIEDPRTTEIYGDIAIDSYTFENWLKCVRLCIDKGIREHELRDKSTADYLSAHGMGGVTRLVTNQSGYVFGFPGDLRFAIRSIISLFDDGDEVVLDYTDLVEGGYYEEDEKLCGPSSHAIVLTEGSTDASLLKLSIETLYPHLSDLLSFLDFSQEDFRPEGGVSFIVKILKVFVSARVPTNIIAVFDNDTAARDGLRNLKIDSLPPNFKVIMLPELELARNYPTIGPGGNTFTDINRRALSLELFFGKDVLQRADGTFTPVQWTSYIHALKEYQGEIENKEQLQKKYRSVLKEIQTDPTKAESIFRIPMRQLLEKIFYAFNE